MSKLAGKVIIVTGASKGIGAATAEALGAEGASVVVNYASDRAGAEKVVSAITKTGGKAVAVGGDVSKETEAKGIVDAAIHTYGKLDVVVNNSGVYQFGSIEDVTEPDFHRQFNINVLGLIFVTKFAVPHLKPGSAIINIGSVVSRITPPTGVVYVATKGAVDAITGVLSRELGPKGIRVNSVNPGLIVTEGTKSADMVNNEWEKTIVGNTPLGRIGQPDDIAGVVVFFASDAARWVSGESLIVSGGLR